MPPNPCSKVDRTSFSALSRSAAVRPTPGPTTQPGARATHIANPAPRTADPSSAAVMIATERQARMRLPPPSGHKRTYPGFADGWSPLQGSTTRTRGSGADSIPGLCRPRSNCRDTIIRADTHVHSHAAKPVYLGAHALIQVKWGRPSGGLRVALDWAVDEPCSRAST